MSRMNQFKSHECRISYVIVLTVIINAVEKKTNAGAHHIYASLYLKSLLAKSTP